MPARFARSRRRGAAPRAICWYKDSATEHVRRMWALARVLRTHGVAIKMLKTSRPGYIVYEDEFQVCAEPFRGELR